VYPEPPEITVMAVTKPAVTVATAVAGSPARHLATRSQSSPARSPIRPDFTLKPDTRAFRASTPTRSSGTFTLPLTMRRAYLRAMPARKHTPPKLLGRHGDLVALGLSRQQIDDAVKSGALRILKRSPKQGQRYLSRVDANRAPWDLRTALNLWGIREDHSESQK